MLNRREFGASAAALLSACGAVPEESSESDQPSSPLYFDLHIDTPSRLVSEGLNMAESPEYSQVDIPKMRQGGLNAGFFAVFSSARNKTPLESVKDALVITDVIVETINRHPDDLFLATTSDDALRAQREGKIGVFLGVEGGHMIDSSIEVLRQLYRLGTRYLGLTHSGNTPWVGAAEYDDGPEGLTDHGREIVREMNRLGMMADLSHASERAFYDTIETSQAPILNTHAACKAVANHARNLTDDMLMALAQNGGVLGVAYYAGMLDDDYRARFPELREINERRAAVRQEFRDDKKRLSEELWKLNLADVETIGAPPLSRLVDHIEHAATVAGIDHVGLGSDYDSVGLKLPIGLEHIGKTPNLIAAMKERGFSDADVAKVMGGNVLRAMRQAEAVAG
jgi:membrane dipeptidase